MKRSIAGVVTETSISGLLVLRYYRTMRKLSCPPAGALTVEAPAGRGVCESHRAARVQRCRPPELRGRGAAGVRPRRGGDPHPHSRDRSLRHRPTTWPVRRSLDLLTRHEYGLHRPDLERFPPPRWTARGIVSSSAYSNERSIDRRWPFASADSTSIRVRRLDARSTRPCSIYQSFPQGEA
jgi:hypothetical protein